MSSPNPVIFVYSTAPDRVVAEEIASALVDAAAAACVNIIPGMTSFYRWRGEIETASEIVLIIKTTRDRAAKVAAIISERHPYETPAVAAIDVDEAASSRVFLDWIRNPG